MSFLPYSVTREGARSLGLVIKSSLRVRFRGIPELPGETPREIAAAALRHNAREVLWAGSGHFRYMWVSDFGKALRGARAALEEGYLARQVAYMIRESARLGRVTTCFSPRRGFDMPWYRADGLPWLVWSVRELPEASRARVLSEGGRALQGLVDDYERTHSEKGLVSESFTGDWMDSVLRPSSTYNNACALMMLRAAREAGLRTKTAPESFEAALLESRWRGGVLTDYAGTDRESLDGAVYALYFRQFPAAVQEALLSRIERSGLARPYPLMSAPGRYPRELMPLLTRFSPEYHSTIWLHLGFMYLNALKAHGRDIAEPLAAMEALILRFRNVLETLKPDGGLYATAFHATEHGLSMAAGQYLELVSRP